MKNRIKEIIRNLYTKALHTSFGINKNRIVFDSFGGKYSDNPRAISEQIHLLAPDIELIWVADTNQKNGSDVFPEYVTCISSENSLALQKAIATSFCWVSNNNFMKLCKSKKQFFVQTWHGDRAFKKILHDSAFFSSNHIVAEEIDGYCDLAIAGSEYGKMQYVSAFRYNGEIYCKGTPRNDCLINLNEARVKVIKQKIGAENHKKVLLYAPTLRRINQEKGTCQDIKDIDILKTLDALEKHDGCEWLCLLRAHPVMCGLTGVELSERIIDVSHYEDMADLLMIADMLITDYSSCAGDYALLERPIILFQSDREDYIRQDRSFYFEMEKSPYYIVKTQEELNERIASLSEIAVKENCKSILKFYGTTECGHSSEDIARIILEWRSKNFK